MKRKQFNDPRFNDVAEHNLVVYRVVKAILQNCDAQIRKRKYSKTGLMQCDIPILLYDVCVDVGNILQRFSDTFPVVDYQRNPDPILPGYVFRVICMRKGVSLVQKYGATTNLKTRKVMP